MMLRRCFTISFALVFCHAIADRAKAVDLLSENFDELALQNVTTFQSEVRGRNVWTHNLPTNGGTWSIDNSALPPETASDLIGVAEFEGWSFVNRDWWVTTADDQDRSHFVSASGTIAVADADEWDDFSTQNSPTSYGHFDSTMRISNIPLQGAAVNSVNLFFHSSWRFEGIQKASLTVKYNDPAATTLPLLTWDSTEGSPNFKDDATNEAVSLPMMNPAGATQATLEFRMYDAGNNWWWAIDNLKMFTGAAPAQDGVLRLTVNRDNGHIQIVNNTGATVNLRGYSVNSAAGALDESVATFLSNTNPNWKVFNNPTNADLSEGYIPDQYAMPTQASNPSLGVINLGNSWVKFNSDISDLTFQYLVAGKETPVQGIVEFIGNSGQAFAPLDLNFDGMIGIGDYAAFLAGYNTSLVGKTPAQQYNLGDLNRDAKHTIADFLEFKRQFDVLRGPGAFAAMVGVPEPGSLLLAIPVALAVAFLPRRRRPSLGVLAALGLTFCLGTRQANAGLPLLTENFEGVPLGQSPEEQPTAFGVWSDAPPAGWTIDRTGVPGYTAGDPANNGVKDWAGWVVADKSWWVTVAGDQDRSQFSRGAGKVLIADDDEWDDAAHPTDTYYNTFIKSPVITIPAGIPAGKIRLAFDSSWKPEGFDDWILPGQSGPTNNQTGTVNVSYNGAAFQNVLNWNSQTGGPNFKGDATNEGVDISLNYNGTATNLQLQFGLTLAANDWFWAIDNVRVFVPAAPAVLRVDTGTGLASIVGGDVINETINGYDISSVNGNLAPTGSLGLSFTKPDSVDGPDAGSVVGNSIDESWQLGAANANQFSEFFLDGSSGFTSSRTESLGQIFNPATSVANRDLQFTYTTSFGDVVTGVVQYVTNPANADFDGNGKVDGADFLRWQRNFKSGTTLAQGDANADGQVNGADLAIWKAHYGLASASGAGVGVPEPGSLGMLVFALVSGGASQLRRRAKAGAAVAALSLISVLLTADSLHAQAIPAPTLDRNYRFGEGDPGAANGIVVGSGAGGGGVTRDDAGQVMMNQLIDLTPQTRAGGLPSYVTITGRPDGVGGLGIRLNPNATDKQYLKSGADEALNYPARSPSSTDGTLPGGTIDYSFITDRGFQLWVQPQATTEGFIVMDSNNHGVLVNAAGKFGMRYSNADYAGVTSVVPNTWYHLMVVRAFGDRGSGSVLYVNGVAEAAAFGIYFGEDRPNDEMNPANQDDSPLVIGSSTSEAPLAVGAQKYFRGIVDDLTMFVMGFNDTREFGEFKFERDNQYAAFFAPTTPGDINGDHVINSTDVNLFASNWKYQKVLTWTQGGNPQSLVVGDLTTRAKGDFNFDGRVDLADWGILNAVNPAMAAAAKALIGVVPEPSSAALAALAALALARRRRRT
jgi:hypothetical protein